MRLRLDLHVHCSEACNFATPDVALVGEIIAAAKRRGLDGIAITDHAELGTGFAYKVRELAQLFFNNGFLIIPGQETKRGLHHVVELYLPGGVTFRFVAHPGDLRNHTAADLSDIHGVEILNGNWYVDDARIEAIARERGWILLRNSDAHSLSDLGRHYNEFELSELVAAACRA